MTPRRLVPVLLAFILLASEVVAQDRPFPYVLRSSDAALLSAGLGLSLLGDRVASGRDALTRADIAPLTPAAINAFDRGAAEAWSPAWGDRSDQGRNALVGAAVLVTFVPLAPRVIEGRWRDAVTLGTMFAESYLLLRGATYTAKGLVGRTRPFAYNTTLSVDERLAIADADPQDARQAFYSGHAAAAFALATLMSRVFTDIHGRTAASHVLWASSLSVAGFTAFARVKAGMHYPSDVLVGAAVGTVIGVGVPWLHRRADRAVSVAAGPGGVAMRVSF
jgi:membrane-associated phospholipid phosphatase